MAKTDPSQTVGGLLHAYELQYYAACKLPLDDSAWVRCRKARRALTDAIVALHGEKRRLEGENRKLNVENRRLADIAVDERQRIRMEGVVR